MPALKLLLPTLFLILTASCSSLSTDSEHGISCQRIEADIHWGALSGLSIDTTHEDVLYAVHDHNLPHPEILVLDVSGDQAIVTHSIPVLLNGAEPPYDLEGITHRSEGGFWLASEGKRGQGRPNLIVRTDESGNVLEEIALPKYMASIRTKAGFEGITVNGTDTAEEVLVIFQRSWPDDPEGTLKIGRYHVHNKQWKFYRYPLDARKGTGASSITTLSDNSFLLLERDNRPFHKARIKRIYSVTLPDDTESRSPPPTLNKTLVLDLLGAYNPLLCGTNGKLEGMTLSPEGKLYLVADDDGKSDAMLLEVSNLFTTHARTFNRKHQ